MTAVGLARKDNNFALRMQLALLRLGEIVTIQPASLLGYARNTVSMAADQGVFRLLRRLRADFRL